MATIHVFRQHVEALVAPLPDIRVFRQHVEVLHPLPEVTGDGTSTLSMSSVASASTEFNRSADNTLDIKQSVSVLKVLATRYTTRSYSLVEQRYRRLVRQVLYGLRRQYGSHIAVYKLIDADTDYSTGVKTIEKTSYELVAIVAPGKVSREVLQSISQISANKTMVYGGTFDSTVKTFVIDGRHLPDDFEFGMDDWIVYNNARFELKDIYKLDYHAGWIITAKEIVGQHAEQIFHLHAGNTLALDHSIDHSID